MSHHIILVGALHTGSTNRSLAEALLRHLPDGDTTDIYEGLRDVPFYDSDLDVPGREPEAAAALRKAVADADSVIFVTPEYNHTAPAVLVNAIDWLSRPYGDSAIKGKPVAVIGAALGRYGGTWAHDDTRKSFGIAGASPVQELALSVSTTQFDGKHPVEHAEFVGQVRGAVQRLADEVGAALVAK